MRENTSELHAALAFLATRACAKGGKEDLKKTPFFCYLKKKVLLLAAKNHPLFCRLRRLRKKIDDTHLLLLTKNAIARPTLHPHAGGSEKKQCPPLKRKKPTYRFAIIRARNKKNKKKQTEGGA